MAQKFVHAPFNGHFEEVKDVFDDPIPIDRQDRIENGEERWPTIGSTPNFVIVLIAHSVRYDGEEVICTVSARTISKQERYL